MFRRIGLLIVQFIEYTQCLYYEYAEESGWCEIGGSLHWAIEDGFSGVAIKLIENGKDVNQLDSNQRSPLDQALKKDDFNVFKALVENQADVNFSSVETGPLLFYAINTYQEDHYAKLLIDKGANVNCVTTRNTTPLHAAAVHGDINIAKLLIHKGARINAQTNTCRTPLLFAADMGHYEVVEMLLANGANVNIRDVDNNEPIHCAAENGHIQCLKTLIEYGASLNTKGSDGYSPIEQVMGNETMNSFKMITFLQFQGTVLS